METTPDLVDLRGSPRRRQLFGEDRGRPHAWSRFAVLCLADLHVRENVPGFLEYLAG